MMKKNIVDSSSITAHRGDVLIGDKNITININGDLPAADAETWNIEELLSLVDRNLQDSEMSKRCKGQGISTIFIHGYEHHRHDLYVERLAKFRIMNLLGIPSKPCEIFFFNTPESFLDESKYRMEVVADISRRYFSGLTGHETIIETLRKRNKGASIFYTSLPARLPLGVLDSILKTHTNFWHTQTNLGAKQPLLVIAYVGYPSGDSLFGALFRRQARAKPREILSAFAGAMPQAVVLPEFEFIRDPDVANWFMEPEFQQCRRIHQFKTNLMLEIGKVLKSKSNVPLKDIADIAHNVVKLNK